MRVPGVQWWRSGVVYQIYPRSFADTDGDGVGDLEGIRQRLDHLTWLGVDAIWLSPIFRSPMADFGYDVADYRDVDPLFGSLADLDRLVAEAHARAACAPRLGAEPHVGPSSLVRRVAALALEPEARLVCVARPGRERRAAQQLDGGLSIGDAGMDPRSGDRPVLPALLSPRAAGPRLGQSRGRLRHARRRPLLARPRPPPVTRRRRWPVEGSALADDPAGVRGAARRPE
jgi:hypothetical protein